MRIVNIKNSVQAAEIFKKIGVDPYGINAMLPKTMQLNILLEKMPCRVANIIKQEMLSVGGDAAVARGSVGNSVAATDVLIMGTVKQIQALAGKIEKQPFGLAKISQDMRNVLNHITTSKFILTTARREITLGQKTRIMGILNITPDSFSDGGLFYNQQKAIDHGLQMIAEGADIIDIGGESTRPGAAAVPAKEELRRVIPVIRGIAGKAEIPISIDTTKAVVAREAIAAGAEIVNDISALHKDRKMLQVVRNNRTALILMHMRGTPASMQKGNLTYGSLMGEIVSFLGKCVDKATAAEIERAALIVDPGVGFGKTSEDNYRIIGRLAELRTLGLPIMLGTSRKSFIGNVTGDAPQERIEGTAATVVAAILNGAHIVRVHDVAAMKKVVAVADALLHS